MCGELEEDGSDVEEILYDRFAAHVHSFLASMKAQGSDSTLNGHLDSLFRESLKRSADNTSAPETVGGYERLAMEPLVLARLAGFMAAHLPLHEDPLKRVMEALMIGYSEGEIEIQILTMTMIMAIATPQVSAIRTNRAGQALNEA